MRLPPLEATKTWFSFDAHGLDSLVGAREAVLHVSSGKFFGEKLPGILQCWVDSFRSGASTALPWSCEPATVQVVQCISNALAKRIFPYYMVMTLLWRCASNGKGRRRELEILQGYVVVLS